MRLEIRPKKLELKHPFTISRWTYTHMESMVVVVLDGEVSGYGEATNNPYYENTGIEDMSNRLKAVEAFLPTEETTPEVFWQSMYPHLSDCPFALCALDEAYHDWYARKNGVPLYQQLGLDKNKQPPNCYTLSIDEPDIMVSRMKSHPWNVYKIKLGTDKDIEIVEHIRKHTDAPLWVDANCAWSLDETIRKSKELNRLGVEMIEQPLPADQWDEMEEVYAKTTIALFADESCKTQADIEKCQNRFHGINIKAMKCGGLTPAMAMIREARSYGLKVMMGCMTESTIGISAIAQLAPLLDYADMDGQQFIKNDTTEGVMVTGTGFYYPARSGTGVRMKTIK